MKTAILTFHFARNYGAVLQCYALQKWLQSQGHEVSVLDYRPENLAGGYKWLDIRRFWGRTPAKFFRKTSTELRVIGSRRKRYQAFEEFIRSNFTLAVPGKDHFDLMICGSDQIWNTRLTSGKDPVYWGTISGKWADRLISYAVSFEDGIKLIGPSDIQDLKGNFSALSVREQSAAAVLNEAGAGATVCCDPVMLLSREEWQALASQSSIHKSNYLLLYQVRYSDDLYRKAETIAREKGLELVVLSAKCEMQNDKDIAAASPADFVKLIADADYVVTSSFHGTALSIVLGKDFESPLLGDGKDSRVADLIKLHESGTLPATIKESEAYLKKHCQ